MRWPWSRSSSKSVQPWYPEGHYAVTAETYHLLISWSSAPDDVKTILRSTIFRQTATCGEVSAALKRLAFYPPGAQ